MPLKRESGGIMFTKEYKFAPVITIFLSMIMSFQVISSPGDWERDYYGTPSFNLGDDQRLNRLRNKTRNFKQELASARQKVKRQSDNLATNRQKKKKNQAKLKKLTSTNANSKVRIGLLTKNITTLNIQIPQAQQQLNSAKKQKIQIKTQLTAASNKLLNLRSKLSTLNSSCKLAPTPACKAKAAKLKQKVAATQVIVTNKKKALQAKNKNIKQISSKKSKYVQNLANIKKEIQSLKKGTLRVIK